MKHKLGIIDYDGFNLFYNNEWTKIEFPTLEKGRYMLAFLQTLTVEQLEHWIEVETGSKDKVKAWNKLSKVNHE